MAREVVTRLSVVMTLLVACTSSAPAPEAVKATPEAPAKVVAPVEVAPPVVAPPVVMAVPSTRPRTIEEARTHLLAIAGSHDLSHLVDLVDPELGLEFTYSPEGRRRTRMKLKLDRASFAAQFAEREPAHPTQYVRNIAVELEPEAVTVNPHEPVVEYTPDAAWGLNFVFKKRGEALVLTALAVWDQEP